MVESFHPIAHRTLTAYLQKAGGEGSRGGKILGHTKSGKPIYASAGVRGDAMSADHRYGRFTEQDHRDASEAHRRASAHKKGPPRELNGSASSKVMYSHDLASRLHDHVARTMASGQGQSKEWHAKKAARHRGDQADAAKAMGHAKGSGDWHHHTVNRLWAQASGLAAQHHEEQAK